MNIRSVLLLVHAVLVVGIALPACGQSPADQDNQGSAMRQTEMQDQQMGGKKGACCKRKARTRMKADVMGDAEKAGRSGV